MVDHLGSLELSILEEAAEAVIKTQLLVQVQQVVVVS
jgi:hypothetical protein